MPLPVSPPEIPRTTAAKYGSAKNRSSDSDTTSATESVRWVTSVRAARLGTNPSSSIAFCTASRARGLTCGESLITRETVPRETPASAATASRVGRAGPGLRLGQPSTSSAAWRGPVGCGLRSHHGAPPAPGACGSAGSGAGAFRRALSAYQSALSFSRRRWLAKSTCTRPKRMS